MTTDRIQWPAVIQVRGDDELRFIGSAIEWEQCCLDADVSIADRLIDARGCIFGLVSRAGRLQPAVASGCLTLAQVLVLVRAHVALQGSCCVAKLGARSIIDALHLIEKISD